MSKREIVEFLEISGAMDRLLDKVAEDKRGNLAKNVRTEKDVGAIIESAIDKQEKRFDEVQPRDWFAKASAEFKSSHHIRFRSSLTPEYYIDLEFYPRGRPTLTQTYEDRRVDWPLRTDDERITFSGGICDLRAEQLRAIALQARLPDVYVNWDQSAPVRNTLRLGHPGDLLDAMQRKFLSALANSAKNAGESISDMVLWVFGRPATENYLLNTGRSVGRAGKDQEPPLPLPIVIDIKQLAPKSSLLTLCWIGKVPEKIMFVEAYNIDDRLSRPRFTWTWRDEKYTLLEVEGLDIREYFNIRAFCEKCSTSAVMCSDPNMIGLFLEFKSLISDVVDLPTLLEDLEAWGSSHKNSAKES